jgi:hypothetical protein
MDISFDDLRDRLTPDALYLFREMAAAHLESTGDRMFIRADTFGGTNMVFTGAGTRHDFHGFDGGTIDDLAAWGLLHVGYSSRGTPNYRVSGEAQRFYRWLMQEEGAAIDQVEAEVQRSTSGPDFAKDNPALPITFTKRSLSCGRAGSSPRFCQSSAITFARR